MDRNRINSSGNHNNMFFFSLFSKKEMCDTLTTWITMKTRFHIVRYWKQQQKMHAPKMLTETEKELKFFNEAQINIQTNMMSIHLECIETQVNYALNWLNEKNSILLGLTSVLCFFAFFFFFCCTLLLSTCVTSLSVGWCICEWATSRERKSERATTQHHALANWLN